MSQRLLELCTAFYGKTVIQDALCKLDENLSNNRVVAVSLSGGSDSDVMLDMIEALEPRKNYPHAAIHYVWFDTGLEYAATKRHLDALEAKYGVAIQRRKAKVPVPLGCKTCGLPFLSKRISGYISRLQAHGFQWEDEPFDVLYARYPKCRAALRWWCSEWGEGSQINISANRLLKEFIIANPPTCRISDGCCKGAKKDVAHTYIREIGADLNIVGVRQAEGGARATVYTSCFSEPSRPGEAAQFRPLFYLTDADKRVYCERRGVAHSDLYEKYGFCRTGCACCPFGSRFEQELRVAEWIDPGLAAAAKTIFGPAYEYTRAYRQFRAQHDVAHKRDPDQYLIEIHSADPRQTERVKKYFGEQICGLQGAGEEECAWRG